jgi:signal transduction histidine kinase
MINATVSHELRNPLNSIIAKNLEKESLHGQLLVQLGIFNTQIKETLAYKKVVDIIS